MRMPNRGVAIGAAFLLTGAILFAVWTPFTLGWLDFEARLSQLLDPAARCECPPRASPIGPRPPDARFFIVTFVVATLILLASGLAMLWRIRKASEMGRPGRRATVVVGGLLTGSMGWVGILALLGSLSSAFGGPLPLSFEPTLWIVFLDSIVVAPIAVMAVGAIMFWVHWGRRTILETTPVPPMG